MTCAWDVDRTCLPEVDENDPAAVAMRQEHEDMAVSILWALSGRQFGQCPVTIRPCPEGSTYRTARWSPLPSYGPGFSPIFESGEWRNVGCSCLGSGCRVSGPRLIHLPGPVGEIVEIRIADVVLDPDNYEIEGDRLYRHSLAWPSQDLSAPLGEPGTWSITYTRGNPVPHGVATLTGLLAAEFIKACTKGGNCRLPRQVQTVTRQGVTYSKVDPTNIFRSGLTGIPEIDIWLASVNPNKLQAAPRVR